MNQVDLSWEWFDRSAQAMAQRCQRRAAEAGLSIDGVIVLGRGGMPLATRLSHLLNVPVVGAVIMSRYTRPVEEPGAPPVDGVVVSPHALRRRGLLLLVDNMISEGVTLSLAQAALHEAGVGRERLVVCALLARGGHCEDGVVGARALDADAWYIFPWETRAG